VIIKIKNLYVYCIIFSVVNIGYSLAGVFSHPMVETLAMCYGAFTFLASYHILARLGILTEYRHCHTDE
jgi:hypothetical protein